MKRMKNAVSLLLVLLLTFTMSATAFAAGTGSITINGVSDETTYEIYRLLDLESYDKTSGAYSYKVSTAWASFFATSEAQNYFSVNADNYASWIAGEDDATVAAFAQLALAYAQANGIAPVKSSDNTGEFVITGTSGKFSGLDLGYYLVDSTAGALCGLTTTDSDAVINAKNQIPTIDKQVQEDLTGMWGDVNTADIGQIVNYMTIIHVAAGAQNYVLHDKMSEGLTFTHNTGIGRGVTEIKHVNSLGVESALTEGTDYTIATTCATDSCTFTVTFSDALVASLKANDRLLVYYNAMLNRHAVIAGDNTNESWLEYGEEKYTTHDQTKTHTFSIDIVKTDSSNQLISGAKFKIYDAVTGGNEIAVVPLLAADDTTPVLDANGNPMYRRARTDETGVEIEVKDGKVTVVGFDNGVYYLEETAAPDGYNKLTARKEFTIADGNLSATFTDGIYSTGSGVHVVNKTGSMLPETGGIGTMMFISCGMMAVLAAGVLLVTKKRMSMIQD
ncbi:MAG: SpaH/EbpB family LPXTG-anchored major pilin [Oscillibacter sp.]|nr:SpaH/EbpB family LPXTG-anchored major pilin [Oscillibacter sp.]